MERYGSFASDLNVFDIILYANPPIIAACKNLNNCRSVLY